MHCNGLARLTTGAETYPRSPDLWDKPMWKCDACDAWCGALKSGKPIGRPANAHLRDARQKLRNIRFLTIVDWGVKTYAGTGRLPRPALEALVSRRLSRYLAHLLGLEEHETIAEYDLETCRRAWVTLASVDYADVRAFAKEQAHAHTID